MNAPLRKVAITVFVLFGLLFANLNIVQVVQGDTYRNDQRNERVRISNYERARGTIVVEGQAVALSRETSGKYKYQRQYPAGELYSAVTGFQSLVYGNTGIEAAENGVLNGDADELFVRRVSDMITGRKQRGGNVVLTLDREVQTQAAKSLRGRAGSAVALDPRTGEILALVTSPTYDPNPFASHQTKPQKDAFTTLNAAPSKP
ncbi:MAG TPA: penicillin-binding transpeptidase domain-containing protein, partial [Cryptosporangiaceae bacterium]|nr:penicillin-binding transpeptidase domain-containing protein [Cryptosporangiaceae bacterium]